MNVHSIARRIPLAARTYRFVREAGRMRSFRREFQRLQSIPPDSQRFALEWRERWPCLYERTSRLSVEPHYAFHPAWAARVLARTRPAKHVDISSAHVFATLVSAFVPFEFYEWRPAEYGLSNLKTGHADLLKLPFADGSVESLSCMHTVEHVGLGRYGDPLDYDGDLKAIAELKRVLGNGGSLLFVVPLGRRPRIRFNANRTYSYDQVLDYFSDLQLREFAYIREKYVGADTLVVGATPALTLQDDEGCGCFWLMK